MPNANHNPLGQAHRGYVYQDAATALALVWAIYNDADEVIVDRKTHEGDLFDDLTIQVGGRVLRRQYKSSANTSATFSKKHLKTKENELRIDYLVRSFQTDVMPHVDEYRICATWMSPTDPNVLAYFEPSNSPGSFDGFPTKRWKLKPDALWPLNGDLIWKLQKPLPMKRNDFVAFSSKLVIELECPQVSLNLANPGPLETLLFEYLANRIGVGRYPNDDRLVKDVVERLIRRANLARSAQEAIVPVNILRDIGLRTDFGRVAQQFPIIDTEEVKRESVLEALAERSLHDPLTIVVGSPGSGKSWLLTELCDVLKSREVLVARHYCYLQPGDSERELRITADAFYANLMAELVDAVPELRHRLTTRFAAGLSGLVEILSEASRNKPDRRIVLVVDGLDHITRVANEATAIPQHRFNIINELAEFPLPEGVALVLGSQPGDHLVPLTTNNSPIDVPPWSPEDLRMLASRARLLDLLQGFGFDERIHNEVTNLLVEKAEGNPLYASFLIRQLLEAGQSGELTDPVSLLSDAPQLNGDLSNYYRYLVGPNGPDAVAEVLAHLDFSVTVNDLNAIFPLLRAQVESSTKRLRPVLTNVSTHGGKRVYHESFRRYVVEDRLKRGGQLRDMLEPITNWLKQLGFFEDPRSYRFLFEYLRRAGEYPDLLFLVGPDFLTQSLIGGHPKAAVRHNLAIAADVATSQLNWPAVTRIAEVNFATEVCFDQKLTDLELYGKAFASLYGAERLAAGLLFDGIPTWERGQGLLLCMHAEHLGSPPPWREYLRLPRDNGWNEGQSSEARADYRGRLAIDRSGTLTRTASFLEKADNCPQWYAQIIAQEVRRGPGLQVLVALLGSVPESAKVLRIEFLLELTFGYAEAGNRDEALKYGQMAAAINHDFQTVWRLVLGGIRDSSISCPVLNIQELTQTIAPGQYTNANGVKQWVPYVGLLAWTSPAELDDIRKLVDGKGWYPAWLAFVIDLSLAEARFATDPNGAEADLLAALECLTIHDNPFNGEPRACDLYSIHAVLLETWQRSIALIQTPCGWKTLIDYFETISSNTTTSLQGAKSGPLSPDDLTSLLLPHLSNPDAARTVLDLIQKQALQGESDNYYESEAQLQFRAVVALMSVDERPTAEERWKRACQCLGGYGFRKDITIYELISSLRAFLNKELEYVKQALDTLQPLIWELDHRTDGSETRSAIISWYQVLCEADPASAILILARQLTARGGTVSWRLEECLEILLECHREAIDPSLMLAILQTQTQRTDTAYFESCLDTIGRLQDQNRQCDALRRLYAQATDDAKGADKTTAILLLNKFVDKYGLPFPLPTSEIGVEVVLSEDVLILPSEVASDSKAQNQPISIADATRPVDVIAALSKMRAGEAHSVSTDDLLKGLVSWILTQLEDGRVDGVRGVVTTLCSNFLHYGKKGPFIKTLASKVESSGYVSYAAELYALAHVYTQNELEWHSRERNEAFKELTLALELNDGIARKAVADGIAQFLKHGCFPVCRARHIVPLSLHLDGVDTAKAAWESAFSVVSHRLPNPGNKPTYGTFHYVSDVGEGWQMEEAFGRLLLARIDHPEITVKRSALVGFATVLGSHPEFMLRGLEEVFRQQTPLTSLIFILQVLWTAEHSPYFVTRQLRADIQRCAESDLPALNLAAKRLLDRLDDVS